jgi:hypothetical protein
MDGLRPAHLFYASEADQLSSTRHQCIQFLLFFWSFLRGPRLYPLGKDGQRLGIDAIGLGEPTECFSEVTDLPRIDDGHGPACVNQFRDELSLQTAGRFEHDQRGRGRTKFLQ